MTTSSPVLLGYGPLDAAHAEFEELVERSLACSDQELHASLQRLHTHLIAHFAQEDEWMRSTDFPAGECHIDEHGKVLTSAAEVLALVAVGNVNVGRSFVSELARWFPGHAEYLDSALAAWMCKRQFGGKPVVLHRRAGSV